MTAIARKNSDRVHAARPGLRNLVPACNTARGSQCEVSAKPVNCTACIAELADFGHLIPWSAA